MHVCVPGLGGNQGRVEARGELKSLCSPTLFFMISPRLLMGPDSPSEGPKCVGKAGGGGLWVREDSKVNARENEGISKALARGRVRSECAPVCQGYVWDTRE